MWGTLLAINSFFVWPISLMFLVYSVGRTVLFWEWKLLIIALIIFGIVTFAQMILGVLGD
jgi:hypothetical protein